MQATDPPGRVRRLILAVALLQLSARARTVPRSNLTTSTRACQPPYDSFPFCNTSLSFDARVRDLISRLEDSDIPAQLTARHSGGGNPGPESNVSRLGIPTYDWGLNCIHGVQSSCVEDTDGVIVCPTSFPNPVNYGMTFNDSLFVDLGRIIATETRALWLAGATEATEWSGYPAIGLDVWSPNINLARDPRWGRNQEVPSEDPLVNAAFGTQYTIGVQTGEDPRYLKTAVTLKHAFAYSLEDSDGYTRHNFNAIVSNATLMEFYFPAFKAAVTNPTSPAQGIMCSYNAVNGQPSCANDFFRQVVRGAWGFDGYISSDTGALEDVYQQHHYVATEAEAACVSIRNGTTDVCSGFVYHDALLQGVAAGLCDRSDVEAALYRTLLLRFRLGLFDPIADQPYWQVPLAAVATPEAQAANALATASSMVLLKHDGSVLPFKPGGRIAVIGPHAVAQAALVGNYLGQLCPQNDSLYCVTTPLQAIAALNGASGVTNTVPGCNLTANSTAGFAAAVALAAESDVVMLVLGIDDSIEAEALDRTSIDLPAIQHQLAAAVAGVGKPTVVVLLNGGMVDVTLERDNPAIGAILEAGYPGFLGASAIADTLFGLNEHCCGKLPYTVYPAAYVNQIAMDEMEWAVGPGRGYRYYTGEPVFPFGFGLALTTFALHNATVAAGHAVLAAADAASLPTSGLASSALTYQVQVTNTGSTAGDEVVFAFARPQLPQQLEDHAAPTTPLPLIKQLLAYQRVHLSPGASTTVTFNVSAPMLAQVSRTTAERVVQPGLYHIELTNGAEESNHLPLRLEGEATVIEAFPHWQRV